MKKLNRNMIIETYKNDKAQQNNWNKKIKANSKHEQEKLLCDYDSIWSVLSKHVCCSKEIDVLQISTVKAEVARV